MLVQLQALCLMTIVLLLLVGLVRNRHMPRVGGKMGRRLDAADLNLPEGFARVERREIVLAIAAGDGADYPDLRTYLRVGTARRSEGVRIYRIAGGRTRIEIPDVTPSYERIGPDEALALLRELPDLRLVDRLHLRDEPSFLDPWVRKTSGQNVFLLGNATNFGLVVLYLPDRRLRELLGHTLLHEWLHLLAFVSPKDVRRFKRANRVETLATPLLPLMSFGDPKTEIYEAWADLGETLFGYDETRARDAALATPVHAMILWRRVEKILRKTPKRFRSTRAAAFSARGGFMRREVAPRAWAKRARRNPWRRLRQGVHVWVRRGG